MGDECDCHGRLGNIGTYGVSYEEHVNRQLLYFILTETVTKENGGGKLDAT